MSSGLPHAVAKGPWSTKHPRESSHLLFSWPYWAIESPEGLVRNTEPWAHSQIQCILRGVQVPMFYVLWWFCIWGIRPQGTTVSSSVSETRPKLPLCIHSSLSTCLPFFAGSLWLYEVISIIWKFHSSWDRRKRSSIKITELPGNNCKLLTCWVLLICCRIAYGLQTIIMPELMWAFRELNMTESSPSASQRPFPGLNLILPLSGNASLAESLFYDSDLQKLPNK